MPKYHSEKGKVLDMKEQIKNIVSKTFIILISLVSITININLNLSLNIEIAEQG